VIDYERLRRLFVEHNLTWNIDGEQVVPSTEQIQDVLASMRKELSSVLYDGTPQIELGHLILQKNASHYDLYVHIGEL
jgi:hypothetical protein